MAREGNPSWLERVSTGIGQKRVTLAREVIAGYLTRRGIASKTGHCWQEKAVLSTEASPNKAGQWRPLRLQSANGL